MTVRSTDRHHPSCQGHIDCPGCGTECCARPVLWADDGRELTVLCLRCFERFAVEVEPIKTRKWRG